MLTHGSRRPLRALQIEVTSRCTRQCAVCPRSVLSNEWRQGDLSREHWNRLERDLTIAQHVHLQGWGEPLLHADLPLMANAAKRNGCTVGITTNGDLLPAATDWLVAERVDIVTVSVAGDLRTHARLRGGSHLDRVTEAAADLAARARSAHARLQVQLSYLLTRGNADQLPGVVEKAAEAGVDELFVTHLDCTPTADLLAHAAFEMPGGPAILAEHVNRAEAVARRRNVRFRGPPLQPRHPLTCALNPCRMVFVAWDGRVGPCVNLLLPVRGLVPRCTSGSTRLVPSVCYGHLDETTLAGACNSAVSRAFVAPFSRRLQAEQEFLSALPSSFGAEALRELDEADHRRSSALDGSPLPSACRGCHKASGW